jgi:hypothetical protein
MYPLGQNGKPYPVTSDTATPQKPGTRSTARHYSKHACGTMENRCCASLPQTGDTGNGAAQKHTGQRIAVSRYITRPKNAVGLVPLDGPLPLGHKILDTRTQIR